MVRRARGHLRPRGAGGRGGLTPSGIAPARLSQQQIDALSTENFPIAGDASSGAAAAGLLYHAGIANCSGDGDLRGAAGSGTERSARRSAAP